MKKFLASALLVVCMGVPLSIHAACLLEGEDQPLGSTLKDQICAPSKRGGNRWVKNNTDAHNRFTCTQRNNLISKGSKELECPTGKLCAEGISYGSECLDMVPSKRHRFTCDQRKYHGELTIGCPPPQVCSDGDHYGSSCSMPTQGGWKFVLTPEDVIIP